MRQGDLEEGAQNLAQAEHAGSPIAENHHMLALLLLHTYWHNLDQYETNFQHIRRHCRRALQIRRNFPEAYHLLGIAQYRWGTLFDQAATWRNESNPSITVPTEARIAYDQAIRHLRKAIRLYDWRIRRLRSRTASTTIISKELDRLRRDRMTAVHQLGDALCAASFYPLAESYYRDVLAAYSNNMRTLIDLAQALILAKNWQVADQFLSREIWVFPEGKWNADVNLYIGWTYAGGINELRKLNRFQKRYLQFIAFVRQIFRRVKRLSDDVAQTPHQEIESILGDAIGHLDYALHQQSRFMTCWRQTDWQTELTQVFSYYENFPKHIGDSPEHLSDFYADAIALPLNAKAQKREKNNTVVKRYVGHLRAWLAWRMHRVKDNHKTLPRFCDDLLPNASEDSGACSRPYPHEGLIPFYQEWKLHCADLLALLDDIEDSGRLRGMAHAQKRLELAVRALDNWKLASKKLHTIRQNRKEPPQLSFGDRWAHDIYGDIALLTVRLLAEAEAYEIAWIVATCSVSVMDWLIDTWNEQFPKHSFKLSPYVGRYQFATLYAWKAYCAHHVMQHDQTRMRLVVGNGRFIGIDPDALVI